MEEAIRVLLTLEQPSGLYVASVTPDYQYVWIRDTCYVSLLYLEQSEGRYERIYHALLDLFKKYRWKIAFHAQRRPRAAYEYIHPRYDPDRLEELQEPWGNAQNDAIGLFLYGIGEGLRQGKWILRDESDRELVQLLVQYLANLEFWHDADNGMWEEQAEIHASSIGACVAGLLAVAPYVTVDTSVLRRGMHALIELLPRESATKECDLAQLSLVYPYQLLPRDLARRVVRQIEQQLLREKGVIRYVGDQYFHENGKEAQWSLGLLWLGLCYLTFDDVVKAVSYLQWTEQVMPTPGVLPELYGGRSGMPNSHTPLAWAQAFYALLSSKVMGGSAQKEVAVGLAPPMHS
ncbi:glycoside hydrolase family 15 protein [Sulfoacidibacillus thermotolerans]|uniref:GH15-like domain-containing protein n=1 Tax=Sulfoacidibacillus thermotolerans TaxID=1765684 RepID=A0A2U3D6M6_SULT2|nr:glycoside hydrolase family 15 protein [Sulfoacidibacillus thermotolerans]PWI56935.1 hypothetical protein BM613_11050 [Sulfoacidibacillus thermotolerans]